MAVSRRLLVWCALIGAACGGADDGAATPPALDGAAPADMDGAGPPPSADGATPPPTPGGDAGAGDGSNGLGPIADAGSAPPADAAPPLMLEIPRSEVPCGGSSCDTLSNVCCRSWSKTSGFGSEETCVTRDACYMKYQRSGENNRVVTRECDGKEDCSAGQVCCVYAEGMPLFADLFNPVDLLGPGGSTICAEESDCVYNNRNTFVASGIPLGELECNDDGDCSAREGTSCQPELSDSHSSGAGVAARPEVRVCR